MGTTAAGRGVSEAVPATWLRRVGALAVDWGASVLIATAILPWDSPFEPLLVFAVEQVVLVGTIGHSLGHRLFGLHVERPGGGAAGPVAALVRTGLLLLVVPAIVADDDGRGFHDRAAGTQIVRLRRRSPS